MEELPLNDYLSLLNRFNSAYNFSVSKLLDKMKLISFESESRNYAEECKTKGFDLMHNKTYWDENRDRMSKDFYSLIIKRRREKRIEWLHKIKGIAEETKKPQKKVQKEMKKQKENKTDESVPKKIGKSYNSTQKDLRISENICKPTEKITESLTESSESPQKKRKITNKIGSAVHEPLADEARALPLETSMDVENFENMKTDSKITEKTPEKVFKDTKRRTILNPNSTVTSQMLLGQELETISETNQENLDAKKDAEMVFEDSELSNEEAEFAVHENSSYSEVHSRLLKMALQDPAKLTKFHAFMVSEKNETHLMNLYRISQNARFNKLVTSKYLLEFDYKKEIKKFHLNLFYRINYLYCNIAQVDAIVYKMETYKKIWETLHEKFGRHYNITPTSLKKKGHINHMPKCVFNKFCVYNIAMFLIMNLLCVIKTRNKKIDKNMDFEVIIKIICNQLHVIAEIWEYAEYSLKLLSLCISDSKKAMVFRKDELTDLIALLKEFVYIFPEEFIGGFGMTFPNASNYYEFSFASKS